MEFLITALIIIIPVLLVAEFATFMVYGWFLPEEELDIYFSKYLADSRLNGLDSKILTGMPEFVSNTPFSFVSKYYINDQGIIPRWSKWTTRISNRRRALLREQPVSSRKLSDL